jgi:hypothetical protein
MWAENGCGMGALRGVVDHMLVSGEVHPVTCQLAQTSVITIRM